MEHRLAALGGAALRWQSSGSRSRYCRSLTSRCHQLFITSPCWIKAIELIGPKASSHTGIPPANPLYLYKHPAPMRNYYFWYVVCAVVVANGSSSVPALFSPPVVCGPDSFWRLSMGYTSSTSSRRAPGLRKQFLRSVRLLVVTGLDICVVLWNIFYFHRSPPA